MWEAIASIVVAVLGLVSVLLQRRGSKWKNTVEVLAREIEKLKDSGELAKLESAGAVSAEDLVSILKESISSSATLKGLEPGLRKLLAERIWA